MRLAFQTQILFVHLSDGNGALSHPLVTCMDFARYSASGSNSDQNGICENVTAAIVVRTNKVPKPNWNRRRPMFR